MLTAVLIAISGMWDEKEGFMMSEPVIRFESRRVYLTCPVCGKEFSLLPGEYNKRVRLLKDKSARLTDSLKCAAVVKRQAQA